MPMDKKIEELAAFLKSGSKIHIKKKNRGKFTASAKAAGQSVQEHAHSVMNDPNATPLQRKRANFAIQAAKWSHKKKKHADGGIVDPEGFEGIVTTNNRPYNKDYVSYINETLRQKGLNKEQRASILANIIEESGGDPYAKNQNGFYGLLQWANNRYAPTKERDPYKELDNQINYIISTKDNSTDKKSWTHGGTGSGFRSLLDAIAAFKGKGLTKVMKGYTLGYVRPSGGLDTYQNRLKVAQQLYALPGFIEGGNIGKYAKGKSLVYKPFTEQTENDESKYKPFIPDTIQDIVSDYKLSFPVEPVRNYIPVEQAPEQSKKESKQEVKTPEFEIEQVTAPRDAVVVSNPSEKMATNGKIYKSSEKQAFKADVYNTYVKALVKRGLDDITANKFAQRLTTQDILESRWGQSTLSQYYNFGGVKDFRKDSNAAVLDTTEYENGQKKTVKQPFRKFNSLEDYINYKIDLIDKNWNVFNDTPENYFLNITKGSRKYATDPKYAEKLDASNKQIWN